MTIDELLEKAQQALDDMGNKDFRDLDAIDTWANAAQAYAAVAQAMILHQSTATIANDKGRVLMVDTGN